MADQKRIAELERKIAELERRTQEALQDAEEARRRADASGRGRQEERRRAEEQIRPTTLNEYLAACHTSVFSKFTIETNPKLSRGPITNPRAKWCPKNLQPWNGFIEEQRLIFGLLNETFPIESRVFENQAFLTVLGDRISQRRIAHEKTLEYILQNSVEEPVRIIIQKIKEVEAAAFEIGDGIVFKNHPHALSDIAEEVIEREALGTPRTPDHRRDLNQPRPNEICIIRSQNGPFAQSAMVYISEYKSPCKLTAQHLRVGLRPMDIHEEVVNRNTIPTSVDQDVKFRYHAERLTASAITQIYHYMIESGLEFGNLTNGEATVFLKIDWNKPETLYYHLAEPKYEVPAHPNSVHVCTAVGQHLAFTLMALGSPGEQHQHGQEERQRAMDSLGTWAEDFETILRSIPENERSVLSDDSPSYQPTTYHDVDRSPYSLSGKRRRAAEHQTDATLLRRDDGRELYEDESTRPPEFPAPSGRSTGQARRRSQQLGREARGTNHEQKRQYCTQRCLLGLVQGEFLDAKCPNVALHRGGPSTHARHPVSHEKWLDLLQKQLQHSLDDGITPLKQGGARGVLFKVTLLAYGYTFLAKGTVQAFISDLSHEAAVYDRLKSMQGRDVPVFLGTIDLRSMDRIYYYFHRVYVVHLTLLSWGGEYLDVIPKASDMGKKLEGMAITALRAMHQEGVIHRDVRFANMLFNQEDKRVVLIDFERASLIKPPRPPLSQVVPKKRRRTEELKKTAVSLSQEDIMNAHMVFRDLA
ncbi:hypothetical protein V8C35DRAFT_291220 [Trichoderma chlorosporum]